VKVPGSLTVVGLGPGDPQWLTPAASAALDAATDLVGYSTYLDRVPAMPGQQRHGFDNRTELDRACLALDLASQGRRVAVVSGGDPGVFAMAAAVFEAVEQGPPAWRGLDIRVEPGVTAMLAAAARVGAPLGNDFCAISLSDNLKPWAVIEQRLRAALAADFVIALYNPASRARSGHLDEALRIVAEMRDPDTPVVFARAVGRADERITVERLADARSVVADMATIVVIGATTTRQIDRGAEALPYVYTPRSIGTRC
jgi:precorrin-3B C17-methyltransferase / cobalt-factor III methyltransferase